MNVAQRIANGTIVGSFVYRAYTPAKCGVVLADLGPIGESGYFHTLRVKMLTNGNVVDMVSGGLNDYEELVEDHRKKLAGHVSKLEKLFNLRQDILKQDSA